MMSFLIFTFLYCWKTTQIRVLIEFQRWDLTLILVFLSSEVKHAVKIPVLIGSGVTLENVRNYLDANALIIGSYFKKEGYWANGVDPDRVKKFMEHISKLREWVCQQTVFLCVRVYKCSIINCTELKHKCVLEWLITLNENAHHLHNYLGNTVTLYYKMVLWCLFLGSTFLWHSKPSSMQNQLSKCLCNIFSPISKMLMEFKEFVVNIHQRWAEFCFACEYNRMP